jgi:ParB family transcriptional regulator, chromosome partitioning protein
VPPSNVETEPTAAELLQDQLVESFLRQDLNPIEEAQSFQRYIELVGCDAKDLAQILNVSPSTVTRALSLLKLPRPIQERIAAGDIPPKTGSEIVKLKDDAARLAMAERVLAERLTAEDAANAVRQTRGRGAKSGRGTRETLRVSNGIEILVSTRRKVEPTEIVTALKEALKLALTRVD